MEMSHEEDHAEIEDMDSYLKKEAMIEEMDSYLEKLAIMAAYRMNKHAEEGDANRNHVNYGCMTQALGILGHLGHFAEHHTWENEGVLICEKVIVDGEVIYEKREPVA